MSKMTEGGSTFGPAETVYVENEWYDGPRAGVADIGGVPHRFKSLFDEAEDEYLGTFVVWPIDEIDLELEIEQWRMFVAWNQLYESGMVSQDSHPGIEGTNQRWCEISERLRESRENVPPSAEWH